MWYRLRAVVMPSGYGHTLQPCFRSRLKRLGKTPQLHFLDSGLLAAILSTTEERIGKDRSFFGAPLEYDGVMVKTANHRRPSSHSELGSGFGEAC